MVAGFGPIWPNSERIPQEHLVEFYLTRGVAYARKRFGLSEDDARNCCVAAYFAHPQETLVWKCQRHIKSHARRFIREAIRLRSAQCEYSDEVLTSQSSQPHELLIEEDEESARLRKALMHLTAEEQEILRLRYRDELMFAEIARQLNRPIRQVKYLEKVARNRARGFYEKGV
jgi:RNA polymerase sigma factor (sigma-70 family)